MFIKKQKMASSLRQTPDRRAKRTVLVELNEARVKEQECCFFKLALNRDTFIMKDCNRGE